VRPKFCIEIKGGICVMDCDTADREMPVLECKSHSELYKKILTKTLYSESQVAGIKNPVMG